MNTDFRIDLGGANRTEVIRPFLEKIKVNDRDGTELDTASITLSYSERIEIPQEGTEAEIFLGYKGKPLFSVFKGIVNKVGINGTPNRLFLSATGLALSDEKRLQSSTTRSWNEKTLGEIANEVITSAGFKARVHNRLSDIEIKRFFQTLETDLELLQKLSDAFGGFLKSDGETVAVLPVRSRESATGEMLPTVTVRHGREHNQVSSFGWTKELRKFRGTVFAFYQDSDTGETKVVTQGAGSPNRKLKTIYSTEAEANAAAIEEVEKTEVEETFTVTMPGVDLAVGSQLNVQGFPGGIVGNFWVSGVEHTMGKNYTVKVQAER